MEGDMTEAEWLECKDPRPMLKLLRGKASDRKLRLFAVAVLKDRIDTDREVLARHEVAERFAEGQASVQELRRVWMVKALPKPLISVIFQSFRRLWQSLLGDTMVSWPEKAYHWAAAVARGDREGYPPYIPAVKAVGLLRDIFGNPFRPVALDPSWRTQAVVLMAMGIYDDRRFDDLPILADALEEAGCTSREVLEHCRSPGPHVRGCWPLDLILGRA
jgi:hypothetical protein